MSTFNTNFAPPASNANQMNLVNGMQATSSAAGAGAPPTTQHYHPFQQQQQILQQKQQQQQQHQQQLPAPIMQQQQHQHQQQHQPQQSQQQQPTGNVLPPPPQFNNTFVNNQMPMSSNMVPTSSANGPLRPPQGVAQIPVSNLPPHLRPPTLNGPTLINGGSEAASANSSRTASPALHNAPPQMGNTAQPPTQTPYTMAQPQYPTANPMQYGSRPAVGVMPPNVMQKDAVMPPNRMNGPLTTASTTNLAQPNVSGVGNLSNSIQNLNLGGGQGEHENRLIAGGRSRDPRGVVSIQSVSSEASGATRQSDISNPSQSYESRGNPIYPEDPLFQNVAPISRSPASIFGSSTGPHISQRLLSKIPYGVQSPAANTATANQANNNRQAMQTAPPLPTASTSSGPSTSAAAAPPTTSLPSMPTSTANAAPAPALAPTTQRKAMYPSSNTQLPPVAGIQQNFQQSPYAQAYQQQPLPQPQQQQQPQPNYPQPQTQQPVGYFNGQTNSGPMQYQSQPPINAATPQASQHQPQAFNAASPYNAPLSVTNQGFSRLWGQDTIDLMQNRHILSPATIPPPKIVLHNQFHESINCSSSIMRCTLAKIPESNSLLQKSRLPLGILIHPFRDINSLPVIQCPNIVRCRLCRTYINPFVYFVDSKMWKCNLCYRVNELPEDFQFDPATKTYGDVTRRPEVRSSTIEFIAPSEYMLRPPQPAIYLFLFDVSIISQQSGYLDTACSVLSKHLEDMPGDARTQVGFIAYDSYVHFYSMADGFNQPHEMTLLDIDDPFLPRPDNLLVNLKECKELIKDLLHQLPKRFAHTHDPGSALGAALQVAYKLMQASGGRVTVFQTCLPNRGPGSLEPREDPNNRSAKDVAHLNPATDFYKRYALECSGYQIAVDLFLLNQQYSDMATISGISKHSGGCVHHFPLYQNTKQQHVDSFKHCFKRYLTRKIGFEAVMRIRCTRGLQVHTFHGNFFVRSTDLLSLPNVNPDAGYGMQISYEESLSDVKTICFQAALLYTNSEGERRIRVHTLCLPVTSSLPEVMHAADTEAIIGLLSKMAVDRSVTSNVSDAREAFINATVDVFNAFKIAQNLPSGQSGQLIAPKSLALMPLYILSLLKHPAFRVGTSTRLDDRVYAMDCMKTLPLDQLMKFIYPEFYKLDVLFYNEQNSNQESTDDDVLPEVPRLQLSAEFLDSRSIFLLDGGLQILIYVGLNVPADTLEKTFGIKTTASLPDYYYGLPNVNSAENDILRRFIAHLNEEKPYAPLIQIIRDTSTAKPQFIEKLVDDRSESSLSYYEFLQHIRTQVK